jgi:Chaperone of endosialidase
MAPKYPSIPEPTLEPTSLRDSILSIKQAFEILTGQRGSGDNAALTPGDALPSVGGTVTGQLKLTNTPALVLDAATSVADNQIQGWDHGKLRWLLRPGNDEPETGSNAGSSFDIHRYADNGSYIAQSLNINRASGAWSINGNVTVSGFLNSSDIAASGDITTFRSASPTTGAVFFGNSGGKYLYWTGAEFQLSGGALRVGGAYISQVPSGNTHLTLYETTGGWAKFIRAVNGGALQFIDNAFSAIVTSMTDGGAWQFAGTLSVQNASITGAPYSVAVSIQYSGASIQYGMQMRALNDTTTSIAFLNSAASPIGSISQTVSTTFFNTTSDIKLKEDLKPLDAGPIIDRLEVHNFKWKDSDERAHGVVAQHVNEVYPLAVTCSQQEGGEEFWGVDYSKFVPLLLQEVKALRERVKQLEAK